MTGAAAYSRAGAMDHAHAAGDWFAEDHTDVARVAALARRAWLLLALAAIAAAALALFAGSRSGETYDAQARLLVGPLEGDDAVLRAAGQQAQTLSQLATSRVVLERANQRLGRRGSATDLARAIAANATGDTRVVTITARAARPATAAALANAVAAELERLMGVGTRPLSPGQVGVVDPAEAPAAPEGTADVTLAAIAALAGLLLALIAVLLVDCVRGRVITEDELRAVSGVTHLGTVRRARGRRGRLVAAQPDSKAARAHHLVAERIAYAGPDVRRRSVVVAGVEEGEAGGRVAAELAASLAADGSHVILVDADAVNTEVTRLFGLERRWGLGELLDQPVQARTSLRDARVAVDGIPNLRVVPLGSLGPNDLPAPARVNGTLARLLRASDIVVVSAGPADASPAALGWARAAAGTVVLVRPGRTRRDAVRRAVEALEQVHATVVGTVFVQPARPELPGLRRIASQRPFSAGAPAASRPEGAGV